MVKKDLINGGKVKSVYTTDKDDEVIIEFRDDMTAGDGERKEVMSNKGTLNAIISSKIFQTMEDNDIKTQFIELSKPNEMRALKLDMIPIEVIVRNIATGSLVRKYPIEDGVKLDPPIVQMDFKDDDFHDPMLNDSIIKALGIATQEEIDELKRLGLKVNDVLKDFFDKVGIILVDFKVEFGRDNEGNIVLADEISPDSCRLWDKETLDMLDKELFRKGKDDEVMDAYSEVFNRIIDSETKSKYGL